MKKRLRRTVSVFIAALLVMGSVLLPGCGGREKEKNTIADLTDDGLIREQTSTKVRNSHEELYSDSFYVLHNGVYYPLVNYENNFDDAPGDFVQSGRQCYFTTENEIFIPTLFLSQGDKLIYYSESSLLDYVVWERFMDLGYTIGVHDLKQMQNGRYYISLDDDSNSVISDSELFSLYDLGVEYALLDKIGGVEINDDLVANSLITGGLKSTSYDLEVYAGTVYKHFTTAFNIHAFRAYELFASVKYKTLQEFVYEIEIPSYFVDGYYRVNNGGLVRIVHGDGYSEQTDFNEQILFPSEESGALYIYSEFEPLNKFYTNIEGKLGYVDPDATKEDEEDVSSNVIVLKEAVSKTIPLFCPEKTQCSIRITSPTLEMTGDSFVTIGRKTYPLHYDKIRGYYTTTFDGTGTDAVLTVTGFFENYEVALEGCYQAEPQSETGSEAGENTNAKE